VASGGTGAAAVVFLAVLLVGRVVGSAVGRVVRSAVRCVVRSAFGLGASSAAFVGSGGRSGAVAVLGGFAVGRFVLLRRRPSLGLAELAGRRDGGGVDAAAVADGGRPRVIGPRRRSIDRVRNASSPGSKDSKPSRTPLAVSR
jgi:hypothetical protein